MQIISIELRNLFPLSLVSDILKAWERDMLKSTAENWTLQPIFNEPTIYYTAQTY